MAGRAASSSAADPVFASHAQAGAEYSHYVGALQSKLKSTAVVAHSYFARVGEDSGQSDLKAFSKDSKDLLTAMENENNALAALAPRIFLAQSDSKYFDSSRDAAQAITSIDVDIARNLAAKTSFDAGVSADLKAATTKVPQLTRKFKAIVLQGYRYFGHAPADVDMSSLTLKR
ncbi:MAG TPA: hypothetical protein VIY90_15655 [Steroidobacteraceae bacterium]